MSTFELTRFENEPIVLCTMHPTFSVVRDTEKVAEAFKQLIVDSRDMFYVIFDALAVRPNVNDIIDGASVATRGEDPFLHHAQIQVSLFVTRNQMMRMAINGLSTEAFGRARSMVYETVEETLTAIREHLQGSPV